MKEHIIQTVPQWKYVLNAVSACKVTSKIDGSTVTLAHLPNGGSACFYANSPHVTVQTEAPFEVFPCSKDYSILEQIQTSSVTTTPIKAAVAAEQAKGSEIYPMPAGAYYTVEHGSTWLLDGETEVLNLTPSTLTTAQEMRVLYTPAEARTTPLIAVPQGVTLHWAGDEEPTWEAGKDYVILLLQTSPTHIEARLFNAPQGVKLPDKGHYVIWDENNVAVAARFDGQIVGYQQFYKNPASIPNIAAALAVATFNEQTNGRLQFSNCAADLYLPLATFEKTENVWGMFGANKSVYVPRATFSYAYPGDSGRGVFDYVDYAIAPSARFDNCVTVNYLNRSVNKNRVYDFSSMTFERVTGADWVFDVISKTGKLYSLNLRAATNAATMWTVYIEPADFTDYIKETILSIAYGPRLQTNESGDFVLGEDGKEIPAPVTRINTTTGDPEGLEPWELTGRRKTAEDVGEKPTGWGIKDFRKVGPDGNFVKKADGNYDHSSTGHSIHLPIRPSGATVEYGGTAAYGEEVAAALKEISDRGWLLV